MGLQALIGGDYVLLCNLIAVALLAQGAACDAPDPLADFLQAFGREISATKSFEIYSVRKGRRDGRVKLRSKKSGRHLATITVIVLDSERAADQRLRNLVGLLSGTTTPPEGIGDEVHHFVADPNGSGSVVFRRGRYVVNVGALKAENAVAASRVVDNALKGAP
jgi:hypothetical protein